VNGKKYWICKGRDLLPIESIGWVSLLVFDQGYTNTIPSGNSEKYYIWETPHEAAPDISFHDHITHWHGCDSENIALKLIEEVETKARAFTS